MNETSSTPTAAPIGINAGRVCPLAFGLAGFFFGVLAFHDGSKSPFFPSF
jgi:hypothetical protein